ncbi:hypothetical protein L9F63_000959 [Diploptera punctata]|uniref:CLIC N-terminal domain-containing protein n=1 Tax=Diploptera punctata TaxID=6984 RepID=A0AAD8AKN2_DIPPU|nr:hypothetical protein L9F63_000959 [Diploptera punctata]
MNGSDSTNLTLFVKAGRKGQNLGACPQSQQVLMVAELKVAENILPQPVDVADDIVTILEDRYPGGIFSPVQEDSEAERATRDFFSRFCFFIRDVSKDPGHLESELHHVDNYLRESSNKSNGNNVFLFGPKPSLLDCEILPKLHQVRVAAAGIKGYEIPSNLTGLWRYLHAAYSEPAFVKTCPSDAEILLHWYEHIGESPASIHKHLMQLDKAPQYSFSVPVYAKPVVIE